MRLPRNHWLLLAAALLLAACGGGGGGGGGAGASPAPEPEIPPVLSGVVSVGAPLGGARIAVVDARGTALGQANAHPTDGSYRLTLSTTSFTLPLLLQARGIDAAGRPVLLHTLLTASSGAVTAHITPLTQAWAALTLGTDPQPVFAQATDFATTLAATTPALSTAASDFLKTLLKTALADLKITDAAALNLLSDARFTTAKSSADLLLEAVRIELEGTPPKLGLANRLAVSNGSEIEVDLASARTELLKATGATPANAITSSAKVTSSASVMLTNAPSLDGIVTTLNPLLAQAAPAITIRDAALVGSYDQHNGANIDALATQLAAWGSAGLQLGPLQVLGCADDVQKTNDCTRVAVASTLTDRSGTPKARLVDVATYLSTPKKWQLAGNGKPLSATVQGALLLRLDATGAPETTGTNPSGGIEVRLQGRTASGAVLIATGTVQTPLGFALPFADCARVWLCLAPPNVSSTASTGGLADAYLQPGVLGWLGGGDALRGARYRFNYTRSGTPESRFVYLPQAVNLQPERSRMPVFDGISASANLTRAKLIAGLRMDWTTWAQRNPQWEAVQIRTVTRYSTSVVAVEYDIRGVTIGDLPGIGIDPALTLQGLELWLVATDASGQRAYTRYAIAP